MIQDIGNHTYHVEYHPVPLARDGILLSYQGRKVLVRLTGNKEFVYPRHADYADIGEAVRDLSRSPKHDLHELFDRVVVNVALGNTDDHLRNHGFLLEEGVWQLSPAFDVNPNPDLSQARATYIAGADMYPDEIDGLLALAEDFGLMDSEARERMGRIAATLTSWRTRAKANGIREREITMMADSIIPRLEMVSAAGGF